MIAPNQRTVVSLFAKRSLDIVLSLVILAFSAVPVAIAAVAVRLTSRGPAFYRSQRAGRAGHPFELLKLRTMRLGSASESLITGPIDGRVTPVGRILRAFKIDELPQFLNVLKGDMAIVGPRPEHYEIVQRHFTNEQRRILDVRPGITSRVQVDWYPDVWYHLAPSPDTPIEDYYLARILPLKVSLELSQLDHHEGLLADLKVIALTVHCILWKSWRKPPPRSPED